MIDEAASKERFQIKDELQTCITRLLGEIGTEHEGLLARVGWLEDCVRDLLKRTPGSAPDPVGANCTKTLDPPPGVLPHRLSDGNWVWAGG